MTWSRGPPWEPGEHGLVDGGGVLGPGEDAATPGPAERLVGGEGDDVGVRHRAGVRAAGDQTGDVGGVEHEEGTDLVGDLPERRRVDDPGVGGGPGHDDLGPVLLGQVPHLVEVDPLVRRGDAVGDELVEDAAGVDGRAVGEVAALVEPQPQDRVAGLEHGQVDGHVGVGAGVGLDVGVLGAEERPGPVAGQLLGLVDHLVAAVVPLARVALAVLVGEDRPGGPQHRRRGEVLRGDELDRGVLPLDLGVDDGEQLLVVICGPRHGIS